MLCGQCRRVLVVTLLVWSSDFGTSDDLLAAQYTDRVALT